MQRNNDQLLMRSVRCLLAVNCFFRMMVKAVCDRVDEPKPVGEFLGS